MSYTEGVDSVGIVLLFVKLSLCLENQAKSRAGGCQNSRALVVAPGLCQLAPSGTASDEQRCGFRLIGVLLVANQWPTQFASHNHKRTCSPTFCSCISLYPYIYTDLVSTLFFLPVMRISKIFTLCGTTSKFPTHVNHP